MQWGCSFDQWHFPGVQAFRSWLTMLLLFWDVSGDLNYQSFSWKTCRSLSWTV